MKAVVPIVPWQNLPITEYAKGQDQYDTLPVWKDADGTLLSRWRLSWRERLTVLFRGDVYLWQMTFNQLLQPISLQVERPKTEQS